MARLKIFSQIIISYYNKKMAETNMVPRLILIGIAIVVLIILVTQYQKRRSVIQEERALEKYAEPSVSRAAPLAPMAVEKSVAAQAADPNSVMPSEALSNEDYKAVDFDQSKPTGSGGDCFPRDKLTRDDLLPADAANSKWAQANPAGQGDVKDQNFLTAGFHVGINTVGQSQRNPNMQLRSDPPNPKMSVSPWNQSTIEYDDNRRFFEVGSC